MREQLTPEKHPKKLSRRAFMTGAGGVASMYAGAYGISKGNYLKNIFFEKEGDTDRTVQVTIDAIKQTYGIEVIVGEPPYKELFGENPSLEQIQQALQLLLRAFTRYPEGYLNTAKIKKVFLVTGARAGKFSFLSTPVDGMAQLEETTMILDVEKALTDEIYTESLFHHELYHLYDYSDGQMDARDTLWREIQNESPSERYTDATLKEYYQQPGMSDTQTHTFYTFINSYGATIPVEDRASFAEMIMIPEAHLNFIQRVKNIEDETIQRILVHKYHAIKQDFFEWSHGVMDDVYWDDLLNGADSHHNETIAYYNPPN